VSRPARALALAAAAVPPALVCWFVWQLTVNLPFWDEWELAPLVLKLHHGGFTFDDFWSLKNEHRVPVLSLSLLALASISGWNVPTEIYAGIGLHLVTLGVLWRTIREIAPGAVAGLLLVLTSALLFSPIQTETWVFGYDLCWFVIVLAAVVAVRLTTARPGSARALAAAGLATVVGTFTVGGGMMCWPTVLVALLVERDRWGWKAIAAWSVAMVAVAAVYFHDYHPVDPTPVHVNLQRALEHPGGSPSSCSPTSGTRSVSGAEPGPPPPPPSSARPCSRRERPTSGGRPPARGSGRGSSSSSSWS
jgi:hypothetical protein